MEEVLSLSKKFPVCSRLLMIHSEKGKKGKKSQKSQNSMRLRDMITKINKERWGMTFWRQNSSTFAGGVVHAFLQDMPYPDLVPLQAIRPRVLETDTGKNEKR